MSFDAVKYRAPSAWASYLINGDASGIDDADIAACDAWIKRVGLGAPVDCEEYGFLWSHDAMVECPLGADCAEFSFLENRNG